MELMCGAIALVGVSTMLVIYPREGVGREHTLFAAASGLAV